jgi:putative DNA primase/helicase
MTDGCTEWRKNGLLVPDIVRLVTEEYLADQDTFTEWFDECVERKPDAFARTRDLFSSWKTWCTERNLPSGTETAFSDTLKAHGCEPRRTKSSRGFKNIELKSTLEPEMPL